VPAPLRSLLATLVRRSEAHDELLGQDRREASRQADVLDALGGRIGQVARAVDAASAHAERRTEALQERLQADTGRLAEGVRGVGARAADAADALGAEVRALGEDLMRRADEVEAGAAAEKAAQRAELEKDRAERRRTAESAEARFAALVSKLEARATLREKELEERLQTQLAEADKRRGEAEAEAQRRREEDRAGHEARTAAVLAEAREAARDAIERATAAEERAAKAEAEATALRRIAASVESFAKETREATASEVKKIRETAESAAAEQSSKLSEFRTASERAVRETEERLDSRVDARAKDAWRRVDERASVICREAEDAAEKKASARVGELVQDWQGLNMGAYRNQVRREMDRLLVQVDDRVSDALQAWKRRSGGGALAGATPGEPRTTVVHRGGCSEPDVRRICEEVFKKDREDDDKGAAMAAKALTAAEQAMAEAGRALAAAEAAGTESSAARTALETREGQLVAAVADHAARLEQAITERVAESIDAARRTGEEAGAKAASHIVETDVAPLRPEIGRLAALSDEQSDVIGRLARELGQVALDAATPVPTVPAGNPVVPATFLAPGKQGNGGGGGAGGGGGGGGRDRPPRLEALERATATLSEEHAALRGALMRLEGDVVATAEAAEAVGRSAAEAASRGAGRDELLRLLADAAADRERAEAALRDDLVAAAEAQGEGARREARETARALAQRLGELVAEGREEAARLFRSSSDRIEDAERRVAGAEALGVRLGMAEERLTRLSSAAGILPGRGVGAKWVGPLDQGGSPSRDTSFAR